MPQALREYVFTGCESSITLSQMPSGLAARDWIVITGQAGVLLEDGHRWGSKEVAVPIAAVTKIGTLIIHLGLTKRQVKDLPPVDTDHHRR